MDNDVFESLNNLGYKSISNLNDFNEVISENNNINLFSKLVSWLTHELSNICKLDERVQMIESINDISSFSLEINSFLKELKCPYKKINENSDLKLNDRFLNRDNKLLLLNFLCSELEAASMIIANKTIPDISVQTPTESEEAIALKKLLIALGFPKPPATITWPQIWTKVETTLKDLLNKVPESHLGKPMISVSLTPRQWITISKINKILNDDFKLRREMLLKRLDVTIQSFKWADRLKSKNDEITKLFESKRKELSENPVVNLSDLLAARDDLCNQEKTCSTRTMTRSQIHKIIIPKVPDRGGRTGELQPPPPEMPAFMQRQQQQNQGPQKQRVQSGRPESGRSGDGKNWSQQQNFYDSQQQYYQQPQQQYNQFDNYRPQSDFERFQNQDYYDRNNQQYQRGGGGGGRGRGGRGNRGGNRY